MDKIKSFGRWCWGNFDKVALAAGWLMSITLPPWLLSYSKNATPIGYFAATGITILVLIVIWAMASRAMLWQIQTKRAARLEGDSSAFDPMARVYHDKRLYLRDLAPLGRRQVVGKTFVNCEIIGPGTATLGMRSSDSVAEPVLKNCNTFDVDVVEITEAHNSQLAVSFYDCDFDGCRFYHMTLLFTGRKNDRLNWITPDFRQLSLLNGEQMSDKA